MRPGGLRNQLDGRQLKICSTCFDIAVGLLRVIEMTLCMYPQVFVAGVTQHSELLLHRLLQVSDFSVFEERLHVKQGLVCRAFIPFVLLRAGKS